MHVSPKCATDDTLSAAGNMPMLGAQPEATSCMQHASRHPLCVGRAGPAAVLAHLYRPGSKFCSVAIPCILKGDLGVCSTPLDVRDVSVGQDQQQFMHTISAEDQALFSPIMCILKGDFGVCSTPLDVRDVSVGQDQQQFMHTISAGDQASPPMVMLPGYGAGSGFYFRNIGGLAQHFRLHCVDLLGTGMSGKLFHFNHLLDCLGAHSIDACTQLVQRPSVIILESAYKSMITDKIRRSSPSLSGLMRLQ